MTATEPRRSKRGRPFLDADKKKLSTGVTLDPPVMRRVAELAEERGVTVSAILRQAVDAGLDKVAAGRG
jgi:predicted DNA-binding protein